MSNNQQEKDEHEKQIEAIWELSRNKKYSNSIAVSLKKDEKLLDVDIDPNRVTKLINWSWIGVIIAIIIFIASIFIIQNPVSVTLFSYALIGIYP